MWMSRQTACDKNAVCPEKLRINGNKCLGTTVPLPDRASWIPSELTSQYLTVESSLPVIDLLPSGVNPKHHTKPHWVFQFATSIWVRESHIQSELLISPAAMYHRSGLNTAERKKLSPSYWQFLWRTIPYFPDADRMVVESRDKRASIWREGDAVDSFRVRLEHGTHSVLLDVPYLEEIGFV